MEPKRQQKEKGLIERFSKALESRLVRKEGRQHIGYLMLLFLMIIAGIFLSVSNLVLHQPALSYPSWIFLGVSLVYFVIEHIFWKKIDQFSPYFILVWILTLILFYLIYAPSDTLYYHWISFIPAVLFVFLGIPLGFIGSGSILVMTFSFLLTTIWQDFETQGNLQEFHFFLVTFYLTFAMALLLGLACSFLTTVFVDKLSEMENKYYKAALTDKLTGLANQARLSQYINRLPRYYKEGDELDIMFIDVDDFKSINDRYGHLVGNDMLIAISDRIRKTEHELAVRWGGDEFVLIERNLTKEEFFALAEKLKEAISAIRLKEHPEIKVTISTGLSMRKITPDFSFDAFINDADEEVAKAKLQGKDTIRMK